MRKRKKRNQKNTPHVPLIPRETLEIAERCELLISGVSGIDEYSRESIGIRTKKGIVRICGDGLVMCWAGDKKLMLRGEIVSIQFE